MGYILNSNSVKTKKLKAATTTTKRQDNLHRQHNNVTRIYLRGDRI